MEVAVCAAYAQRILLAIAIGVVLNKRLYYVVELIDGGGYLHAHLLQPVGPYVRAEREGSGVRYVRHAVHVAVGVGQHLTGQLLAAHHLIGLFHPVGRVSLQPLIGYGAHQRLIYEHVIAAAGIGYVVRSVAGSKVQIPCLHLHMGDAERSYLYVPLLLQILLIRRAFFCRRRGVRMTCPGYVQVRHFFCHCGSCEHAHKHDQTEQQADFLH